MLMHDQALAIDALKKVDRGGNDDGCGHSQKGNVGCKAIQGDGYPKVIPRLQKYREIVK